MSSLPSRGPALAALALLAVGMLTLLPASTSHDSVRGSYALRATASLLRGDGGRAAFAQDYVGARAMLYGGEPYPLLGPAFARVGIDWDDRTKSTHPPTAFLFALPLAPFSWPVAGAIWAFAMIASLVVAFRALGLGWPAALLAGPAFLLWTPAAWSVPQITIPPLLGLALAWRYRATPAVAGAAIGFASLPKFVAAVAVLPLLRRRGIAALAGFAAVWAAALAVVLVVDAGVVLDYLETNREESRLAAERLDNAAVLVVAGRIAGPAGSVLALAAVAAVAWLGWRRWPSWDAWAIWVWLTVALLPIVWIASLVPLGPWLFRLVWSATLVPRVLAGAALLLPALSAQFGEDAVVPVALAVVLSGIAFAAQALGVRSPAGRAVWRRAPT